ncbi:ISL3 family transposase [Nocardia sp. CA-120079]|uniref:ISL3 family transposase n=1 Tax=Nocardia sp. CA-120079 TaxID=3239974 RepID=UPI003D997F9D
MLPHLTDLVIIDVDEDESAVVIEAAVAAPSARCPRCGTDSARVHSRYRRRLTDTPIASRSVVVRLLVRRFFCVNIACAAKTFTEQVEGLTRKRSRRTDQLTSMLTAIGSALAGRAGTRLARLLGLSTSRDTLLRLIRGLPDPPVGAVTVLGVDDFAIRRGQSYATVLLDMATHRPIDVLAGRDADPLAEWLAAHPQIEVITRDRAGAYAEGARRGAPQATQCADRWHLWHNLGQAVEKTVIAHRSCLTAAVAAKHEPIVTASEITSATPTLVTEFGPEPEDRPGLLQERARERFDAVKRLHAEGKGLRTIAAELGIDRKTARRYAAATSPDDVIAAAASRVMLLDEFVPHLLTQWNSGRTDIAVLTAELRRLGYRGSQRTVYRFLQPYRTGRKPARPAVVKPVAPKIRTVVAWIMRNPDNLPADDAGKLSRILDACPELAATRRHVGAFAVMMRDLRGERLHWIDLVRTDDLPALHSFTTGLKHDFAAVTAGLTLPFSNGATEGAVTRIKALKRQMYGRAGLDLLRKRVLHPN